METVEVGKIYIRRSSQNPTIRKVTLIENGKVYYDYLHGPQVRMKTGISNLKSFLKWALECGAGILAMNPKAFDESLEFLKAKAETFNCMDVCSYIFDDPRFAICSGSGKPHQHHNGDGGLVIHTAEVVRLCLTINLGDWTVNGPVPIVSCKQLFLAAFFHDVGKMWDYQRVSSGGNSPDDPIVTSWTGTTHRRNIHHISRSALTWQKAVDKADAYPNKTLYSQEFVDEVLHAILSHHGMREWGSPVAPNSKLAWILHLCDGLSARLDDCLKFDHIKE